MSAGGPVRVGIVGLGYWGINVARNLSRLHGTQLAWCCDADPDRGRLCAERFPQARFGTELEALLGDEALDAIAIATPVSSHAELARRVLEAGKDCFVEKPVAHSLADAERLTELAGDRERVLMVGHLLCFHPAVEQLKRIVDDGELGEVHYMYSQRVNLGQLRADENALWSLGAHDVSVLLMLTGEAPVEVSARGESYVRDGVEDVVFCHLRFPSGSIAHLHLSWLDPHKERRLTVVGSRRMAVFDDMQPERKLTVFDKGFDPDETPDGYMVRSGASRSPALAAEEPLRIELEHFVERVRDRASPRSDGEAGARVVGVLEALQSSLESDGRSIGLTRERTE